MGREIDGDVLIITDASPLARFVDVWRPIEKKLIEIIEQNGPSITDSLGIPEFSRGDYSEIHVSRYLPKKSNFRESVLDFIFEQRKSIDEATFICMEHEVTYDGRKERWGLCAYEDDERETKILLSVERYKRRRRWFNAYSNPDLINFPQYLAQDNRIGFLGAEVNKFLERLDRFTVRAHEFFSGATYPVTSTVQSVEKDGIVIVSIETTGNGRCYYCNENGEHGIPLLPMPCGVVIHTDCAVQTAVRNRNGSGVVQCGMYRHHPSDRLFLSRKMMRTYALSAHIR